MPQLFYSPSTGGFYDDRINTYIPGDAISITAERHAELMAAQTAGKIIKPGRGGKPCASAPVASQDDLAAAVRARRDALLAASDWTQGKDIPDSISNAWAGYRQALRDIPQQEGFPASVSWPEAAQ